MSKAGPSVLRATLFRAADTARRHDPQLARIYYLQMTERGATHLKACCVVVGHPAERAWTVLNRGTPYVICDNNGNPVTPGEARQIITECWTVPEDVPKRRRSRKTGKVPRRPQRGRTGEATLPAPDRRGTTARQSSPPPPTSPNQHHRGSSHRSPGTSRRARQPCPHASAKDSYPAA